MNKKHVVTILVIVLLGMAATAMAWLVLQPGNKVAVPETESSDQPMEQSAGSEVVIKYTDSGFEPSAIAAKKGDTLRVENESSGSLEFSSDDHPMHTDNPELNMSPLASGESGVLVLTRSGEWGIHNHVKDEDTAYITVE